MANICMAESALVIISDLFKNVEFALNHKFKGIELWCDFPNPLPRILNSEIKKKVKDVLTTNNLLVSLHATMADINIASLNKGIRDESVKQLTECIDLAAELDSSRIVVVHCGRFTYTLAPARELTGQPSMESIKYCLKYAENKGVTLALENIGLTERDFPENNKQLVEIVETLNSPYLKITWDIGHSNVTEGVANSLKILGNYIAHIHISDNSGKHDEHLGIGSASIDYTPALLFLKNFKGLIVLEILDHKDYAGALLKSRDNLEKMLENI